MVHGGSDQRYSLRLQLLSAYFSTSCDAAAAHNFFSRVRAPESSIYCKRTSRLQSVPPRTGRKLWEFVYTVLLGGPDDRIMHLVGFHSCTQAAYSWEATGARANTAPRQNVAFCNPFLHIRAKRGL